LLDAQADGSRAIVETAVTGLSGSGELVISDFVGDANVGAPVLNEYGESVGTATGEFVRRLAHTPHFVNGVLGAGVERQGPARIPFPVDQRFRFSRREESCVAFVTWNPARKEDSTVAFDLFDEDNRRLAGTDPVKAKLRPGESFVQYWTVPLARLVPGIYRVDVILGPDPVWRTFFRVTE
jgi:hypothetical protein